jgi:hypothetical protein
MPSRFFTLTIIAFWLATVGLFVYAEVWPRLASSEPLLFPVDVVDEAGGRRGEDTDFEASKNGTEGYHVEVVWRYHPEDDSFESEGKLKRIYTDEKEEAPRPEGPAGLPQVHSVDMESSYRLTRAGETKAIRTTTQYDLATAAGGEDVRIKAEVTGAPRAGRLVPHLKRSPDPKDQEKASPFVLSIDRDAGVVPVPARGTVLNPLHPPRRFVDLAADQRWQLTVIDPFVLGEAKTAPDAVAFVLEARVLPEAETVKLRDEIQVSCRVVECTGAGPVGPLTYWLRPGDGAVMQVKVTLSGDSWELKRLRPGYKMRFPPKVKMTP